MFALCYVVEINERFQDLKVLGLMNIQFANAVACSTAQEVNQGASLDVSKRKHQKAHSKKKICARLASKKIDHNNKNEHAKHPSTNCTLSVTLLQLALARTCFLVSYLYQSK